MESEKRDIIKNILYMVYEADEVRSRFQGKLQFMNLDHMVVHLRNWDAEQLKVVEEQFAEVMKTLKRLDDISDELEFVLPELVDSYNSDNF